MYTVDPFGMQLPGSFLLVSDRLHSITTVLLPRQLNTGTCHTLANIVFDSIRGALMPSPFKSSDLIRSQVLG